MFKNSCFQNISWCLLFAQHNVSKTDKFTGIHSGHNENSNERGSEESTVFFKYDNNNDTKKLIDNLRDYQINSSKVVYKAFI